MTADNQLVSRSFDERHSDLAQFLENVSDTVLVVGADERIEFVNRIGASLFGYQPEELVGLPIDVLIVEELREAHSNHVAAFFNGSASRGMGTGLEIEALRKDGELLSVEIGLSRFKPEGLEMVVCTVRDITQRKTAERRVALSEARLNEAQRIAKIGNWEWNLSTDEQWWSRELYSILEEVPYALPPSFDRFLRKVHPDDRVCLQECANNIPTGCRSYSPFEIRLALPDGTTKIAELLVELRLNDAGIPTGVIGTIHDVTERKELECRLRESEDRYASTVELAAIGIGHIRNNGRLIWMNPKLCTMLGYTAAELLHRTMVDISHPEDILVGDREQAQLRAGEIDSYTLEKRYRRKDGEPIWGSLTVTAKRGSDGAPEYYILMIEDISDRKEAEERIQYLATHDELTALMNRASFGPLLDHAIESARRHHNTCAVLFIDLDRFKVINDSLGHEAGDHLLQKMSARLLKCVRRVDTVARLGGDEFVVLLEELTTPDKAAEVANKILSAVLQPVEIKGLECRVTASIGIATYPKDAMDSATLMRHADTAMYLAKEAGKNNFQFFSKDIGAISARRLTLETQLGRALERNEFSIRYQPRIDLRTGVIRGTEALLRWWNRDLGTIPPAQFIPLAEDTGLIVPIGMWALTEACHQSVRWQQKGLPPIVMAVNLSSRQFTNPDLVQDIARMLDDTGMAPNLLELEITESMIMNNVRQAAERIRVIKNLGVRIAIDDFGTGYSSLAQLKSFPIDTLKIDRSFIRDIPNNAEDKAITEAIISLSKILGVSVIAEGVETLAQYEFVKSRGCDEAQGFYFSKACHPDALARLLTCNHDRIQALAV